MVKFSPSKADNSRATNSILFPFLRTTQKIKRNNSTISPAQALPTNRGTHLRVENRLNARPEDYTTSFQTLNAGSGEGGNPWRRARCCCPVTAGPPCCAACYLFPRGSSARQPRFALFIFLFFFFLPPPQRLLVGASPKPSPPCYRHPSSVAGCWGGPSPPSSPLLPMVFLWGGWGLGGSSSLVTEAPRCLGRAPVLPDPA